MKERPIIRRFFEVALLGFILLPSARAHPGACETCALKGSCVGYLLPKAANEKAGRIEVGGVVYDLVPLGSAGKIFEPKPLQKIPKPFVGHPTYESTLKKWNFDEFKISHPPIVLDRLQKMGTFSKNSDLRVLELPVKIPGSDVRVPSELAQFEEAIERAMTYERTINPEFGEYYAYLTVDQGLVTAGDMQRRAGTHVDGFQGPRQGEGYEVDHSYVVFDSVPTVFYDQPFNTAGLDPAKHNYFTEMDKQVDPLNEIVANPGQMYFMNSYTLHRASASPVTQKRTFFRLTFSKYRYDRLGETSNPMFKVWERTERSIPANLTTATRTSENFAGFGFVKEVLEVGPDQHTIEKPLEYVKKQLGTAFDPIRNEKRVLIAIGDVQSAKRDLEQNGWTIGDELPKQEGFHRIFRVRHRTGATGVAIVRVNTPERLVHVQALLKIAGADPERVLTIGTYKSWSREFSAKMKTPTAARSDSCPTCTE